MTDSNSVEEPIKQPASVLTLSIVTFVAFVAFAGFIFYLYFFNENKWQVDTTAYKQQVDSLKNLTQELQVRLASQEEYESKRAQHVYEYRFDPFDSENFRLYGLYRDVEKKYSTLDVALMFNISNAKSIKYSDVIGERWFIVPIKGVHYYSGDETITEIAMKYYEDPADSVLITRFNLEPEADMRLFIPFGKN
ncbi:hypothetical protein R9C00_05550 [Flammeovirgaceae bacterium SG7u.111]|nr:hypothetical protein [Flammeovirgaceae bacterium SG7u.132]WPO36906.1 hypothetical protein R9C00_05550 [Flammeovirgaceae bacterium SG7u.111]